jgi:hypothetical protein
VREFLIYLDQNILTHADDNEFASTFRKIKERNAYFAISHVHLIEICRSNEPSKFAPRIKALSPLLLRSCEADDPPSFSRDLIADYNPKELIEGYMRDFAKIHFSLIQAHLPLLKMMGGLDDVSSNDLLRIYLDNLEHGMRSMLSAVPPSERSKLELQLTDAKHQITRDWEAIDFQDARHKFDVLRARIRADGKLHQIPVEELIEHVRNLAEKEEPEIFAGFPRNFAQTTEDATTMISSFCMLLNALGAIPKTGKFLRGTSIQQERVLFAQILDNHHIGEAAVANVFLTCDALAARLASAVFSYAGVGTQVWLMKAPLSNP